MGYRVFISHGWADRWVASRIAGGIVDAGATTFIDVNDVAKGDDIEERVFAEMRSCRELVVLFTPWAVDRNWLWVEIGAARSMDLRIVAILYQIDLPTIESERGGSTFLRGKNLVDINELDTYFLELKRRVTEAQL